MSISGKATTSFVFCQTMHSREFLPNARIGKLFEERNSTSKLAVGMKTQPSPYSHLNVYHHHHHHHDDEDDDDHHDNNNNKENKKHKRASAGFAFHPGWSSLSPMLIGPITCWGRPLQKSKEISCAFQAQKRRRSQKGH